MGSKWIVKMEPSKKGEMVCEKHKSKQTLHGQIKQTYGGNKKRDLHVV